MMHAEKKKLAAAAAFGGAGERPASDNLEIGPYGADYDADAGPDSSTNNNNRSAAEAEG